MLFGCGSLTFKDSRYIQLATVVNEIDAQPFLSTKLKKYFIKTTYY